MYALVCEFERWATKLSIMHGMYVRIGVWMLEQSLRHSTLCVCVRARVCVCVCAQVSV